jgi:superfamily I DNA/RNA helicase
MPYYFQLPPITKLTPAQQTALNETKPLALSGGPGTGKSVVSLWRHVRNYSTEMRKSVLLTFTKTLCTYLTNSCLALKNSDESWNSKIQNAAFNINNPDNWTTTSIEEIIIDEAQDLSNNKINNYIPHATWGLSYCADNNQILYKTHCTQEKEFLRMFPGNVPCPLDENFRNTYEIIFFTKELFSNFLIQENTLDLLKLRGKTGRKPHLFITKNNAQKQINIIIDIIKQFYSPTHNIAILVPLRKHVDNYFNILSPKLRNIVCSKYYNGLTNCSIENIHITTFKSAKGLEFDTVIIPDFQDFHHNVSTLNVINEEDYYVAITRAKNNLYLISSEELKYITPSSYEKEIL